ncbi:MAG: hypothetical protein QM280_07065 [Bacteroidota bacterium]|nr:hypothetical protein [Bacteroidota bacterium]
MYLLKILGSSLSLPAHGWVGARATSFLAAHFALRNTAFGASEKSESGKERAGRNSPQTPLPPRPKNKIGVAKRFRRLGIKTSKQNNFQFLLRKIWRAGDKKLKENCFALLAEVRRAETRSEAIQAFFVQKRFELRSVIATRLNFFQIQRRFVARSPPRRRGAVSKNPSISELNRKVGQIQIQFFGKANGGSACEARNKQSLFPIFSIPPKAEYKASFLIPRFCAVGAMAKGDFINFKE